MISWMIYALLLGTLFALAALAAERASRRLGMAGRWMWIGAIVLTLVVPVVAPRLSPPSPTLVTSAEPTLQRSTIEPAVLDAREPTVLASVKGRALALISELDRVRVLGARADRAIRSYSALHPIALLLWVVASLAMLGVIGIAAVRLGRARRSWALAVVDEHFVRVSEDIGPAVVGFLRGEIVVPTWALDLSSDRRAMLLAHEREHLAARDPLLLAVALGALVAMPWNVALWWQVRRLRLAIEMDCDRRVLRRGSDVRAYGALLIEVGRRSVRTPLAAAAFSEPATHLERRITMMLARTPRWRALRAAALAIVGAGLVFVACDMQPPTAIEPEREVALSELGTNGKSFNVGDGMSVDEIRAAIATYYPDLLTDQTGRKFIVQLVLDAQGNVTSTGRVLDRRALEVTLVPGREVREAPTRATVKVPEGEMELVRSRIPRGAEGEAAKKRGEEVNLVMLADTTRLQADRIEVARVEGRAILRAAATPGEAQRAEWVPTRRSQESVIDAPAEATPRRKLTGQLSPFMRKSGERFELDKIEAEMIESVEVIKGSVLGTSAPAVSGVIVIRMKF